MLFWEMSDIFCQMKFISNKVLQVHARLSSQTVSCCHPMTAMSWHSWMFLVKIFGFPSLKHLLPLCYTLTIRHYLQQTVKNPSPYKAACILLEMNFQYFFTLSFVISVSFAFNPCIKIDFVLKVQSIDQPANSIIGKTDPSEARHPHMQIHSNNCSVGSKGTPAQ